MKEINNKKGFTLIELLAVIVILGILIALAIPAVTRYIDESKKKTYIKTIDSLVDTVRYGVNSSDSKYEIKPGKEKKFYFKDIKTEKATAKSPYGDFVDGYSYVLVQRSSEGNYTYKVQVKDSKDYVVSLTNVNSLSENSIKKVNDLTEEERTNLKGYPTYSIGDVITFAGSNWYVIKDSTESEDYVTLLKEKVLTNSELGEYALNDTYDTMGFHWSDTCYWPDMYGYTDRNDEGCTGINYSNSKVREMLEEKYLPTLDESNLKEVDGYRIRLIQQTEAINNLGWSNGVGSYAAAEGNNVPTWAYSNFGENKNNVGGYWTMEKMLYVNKNGMLQPSSSDWRYGKKFGVRPVINLYKSAIE